MIDIRELMCRATYQIQVAPRRDDNLFIPVGFGSAIIFAYKGHYFLISAEHVVSSSNFFSDLDENIKYVGAVPTNKITHTPDGVMCPELACFNINTEDFTKQFRWNEQKQKWDTKRVDIFYYHIEENYGYCELVDAKGQVIKEQGVLGEMVGTTFCNKLFPLIRYKTGDYSKYADTAYLKCGQRSLDEVEGRWANSTIYKADGTYINTANLNFHNDVYSHIDGLQYLQEEVGKLIVCIIKNKWYTHADEQVFVTLLGMAMGSEDAIEIRYVDKLIFQSNGKFLQLISTVKK